MKNDENILIDTYNKYFISYINHYTTAERQAEQFQVISLLKNVATTESTNSIMDQAQSVQKNEV